MFKVFLILFRFQHTVDKISFMSRFYLQSKGHDILTCNLVFTTSRGQVTVVPAAPARLNKREERGREGLQPTAFDARY